MFFDLETTVLEKLFKVKFHTRCLLQWKIRTSSSKSLFHLQLQQIKNTYRKSIWHGIFSNTSSMGKVFLLAVRNYKYHLNKFLHTLNVTYLTALLNTFPTLIYSFKSTYITHLDLTKTQGCPGYYSDPHLCRIKRC